MLRESSDDAFLCGVVMMQDVRFNDESTTGVAKPNMLAFEHFWVLGQ